jgi:hypothetical protein
MVKRERDAALRGLLAAGKNAESQNGANGKAKEGHQ